MIPLEGARKKQKSMRVFGAQQNNPSNGMTPLEATTIKARNTVVRNNTNRAASNGVSIRRGQTLLEAIIAIAVIVISLFATVTLIVSTIYAGRLSQTKIEAANFAREGVEIVRQVRDSNWLKRDQNILDNATSDCAATATTVMWDDSGATDDGYIPLGATCLSGTRSSDQKCYYVAGDPLTTGWSLKLESSCPTLATAQKIVALPDNTYFTQDCVTCTETRFRRKIEIEEQTENPEVEFGGVPKPIKYLEVKSTVSWAGFLGIPQMTATERLYDWK